MASPLMAMTGEKRLERKLLKLGDKVARRVLRKALNAAATPVLKAARSHVPVESGLLKKSLGKKVDVDKRRKRAEARVGARTSVQGDYGGEARVPWRYAHLVELGHVTEDGQAVPPHPFLRPAADEAGPRAAGVLAEKLAEGVAKEAASG